MAADLAPTGLQLWLVRAAALLAALPLGTVLVAILLEGEASAGEALLAVLVVAAAVALAAAPLACRRRGPFRAAAAAYTCVSPTPTLGVTFTTQREANRFARSATGYTALESVGG